jgi:PAS domain S-box-containing protein
LIVTDLPDGEHVLVVVRPDARERDRELFELIFHNAPDIITIMEPERGQLLVNAAAERQLGHNTRRLDDNHSFVHPDDLPRVRRDLMNGGPVRYRVRTAWDEWRHMESTATDLRHLPPVSGVLVFTRDVTDMVETTERVAAGEARMTALVTGLQAGILVQDEDRRVVAANDALCTMFGIAGSARELAGRPAGEVIRAVAAELADPAAFVPALEHLGGERAPGVAVHTTADGRSVELEVTPIRAPGGHPLGHLLAFRDVSERVADEARRSRMVALEQEARRAAEEQSRRLHELDRMRTQLIATVSHELRTPLTPIASHVELLLEGFPAPPTGEQRTMLEAIQRNVARLRRLVDDLLTVRRVEQGLLEITPGPLDLPALVAAQVDQFRPSAARLGVELCCEVSPGPQTVGDADRVGTVIDNLLANALKFTPEGGRVTVSAVPVADAWEVTVTDTGRGIDAADLPRVFDPFFRTADAEHDGLPGSGLGLAVARALVDGHGGTISVTSTPGAGSEFLVRLPAYRGSS